jgi:acetoacetyl-CoA synthetase
MLGAMRADKAAEGELLWEPSEQDRAKTRISAYLRWLAARGLQFGDYDALWRWSVDQPGEFWETIWEYFRLDGHRGDGPAMTRAEGDENAGIPGVHWFPGATVNYARTALRAAADEPGRTAVIFRSEARDGGALSYGELAAEVARVQAGLRELGVGRGDRVAAYLPNIPEALIALLATASLGAIWSSCSPDFGAPSVVDRFSQIAPKVLIVVDGYRYGGKDYRRGDAVRQILEALRARGGGPGDPGSDSGSDAGSGGPEAVITVDHLGTGTGGLPARTIRWAELGGARGTGAGLEFTDVPFEHPLWVLYSSGTTGLPKPIMHGHGGVILEHLKALGFHQDLGPGDVFFWYTTTGWMMWNYLAGGLLAGTTVVLYDGSATHPGTDALWALAGQTGMTYFGTGAPYLMAGAKAGLSPGSTHDLSALRGIGSTGSPLPPEGFRWVYERVKRDVLLGSFSGGTDLCTGFVGPSPLLPVRAGIIACRCLAAKVEAFDPDGKPLTGEVGELVITEPMPSMPVGFWNDPGGQRYHDSYFSVYPGIWRHGDWIKILPDGGSVIYGRSDATLNRGGVRMGTSEFYRIVEQFDEVADSLVVDTGELGTEGRLVLYVVPAAGHKLDNGAIQAIRDALRTALSPRHVPDEIHQVPGIPRTLSGKKLEVPVRKILLGVPVEKAADPAALADPHVLRYFQPS